MPFLLHACVLLMRKLFPNTGRGCVNAAVEGAMSCAVLSPGKSTGHKSWLAGEARGDGKGGRSHHSMG